MEKKVVAITTAKNLWLAYHVYLSYTWSFMHCNVMYFSSGSVPQYDINNLINSTQNKLNL